MTCHPQIWITDEMPARALIVKGRSGVDPDCLVAFVDGDETKAHCWIVDDGDQHKASAYVCGLGGMVYARRLKACEPPIPKPLLPPGRHEGWRGVATSSGDRE